METYSVRFLLQRGVSVAMLLDTSDPLVTYHIWFGPFSDSLDRLVFPHRFCYGTGRIFVSECKLF
jgi:hypothetical protein